MVKGEKVEGFWLAGADGKFFPAEGQVDGDRVVVTPRGAEPCQRAVWVGDCPAAKPVQQGGFARRGV